MKTNVKVAERAIAPKALSPYEKLKRTCCTALLGEDNFYEDGQTLKDRVVTYLNEVSESQAVNVVKFAKDDNKLRHMPLYLLNNMLKKGWVTSDLVEHVCTRPDDITEILAMYWNDSNNKHGLPKQLLKGLQKSFNNFDEYQLSKYRANDNEVKLRDALRIVRPDPNKSKNSKQSETYNKIVNNELKMDKNTWEVAISACGKDSEKKKAEWTRLLTEKTEKGHNKLGALALLRNLRNMDECGVSHDVIRSALKEMNVSKILPFQLIGAARHSLSEYADILQDKLLESIQNYEKLEGDTLFLLDTSGSMGGNLSSKSELNRLDACAGVAAILDGVCEESTLYTFNTQLEPISKAYHGMAMIDQVRSRLGGGTYLIDCTNEAIKKFCATHEGRFPSRVIVISDEQDNAYQFNGWGRPNTPLMNLPSSCKGYVVNVASYENGVNYSDKSWTRINGFSEAIVKYITEYEKLGKRK